MISDDPTVWLFLQKRVNPVRYVRLMELIRACRGAGSSLKGTRFYVDVTPAGNGVLCFPDARTICAVIVPLSATQCRYMVGQEDALGRAIFMGDYFTLDETVRVLKERLLGT